MNPYFHTTLIFFIGLTIQSPGQNSRTSAPGDFESVMGIPFAQVEERTLFMDLHKPVRFDAPGLILYVHAGAWRAGSRDDVRIRDLTRKGWPIASMDYRLSPEAPFPANIHDIKAAIRFLRAKGKDHGVQTDSLAIVGCSAGGHLAVLAGVTSGHPELDGTVGLHLEESTRVQAIVTFYGASNLTTILSQSTPKGLEIRAPALELLLGGPVGQNLDLARLASPVFHIDGKDPPLLVFHGDQDPYMPINQAHELAGAYQDRQLPVHFKVIHGGGHGGSPFYDEASLTQVDRFLRSHLDQTNE